MNKSENSFSRKILIVNGYFKQKNNFEKFEIFNYFLTYFYIILPYYKSDKRDIIILLH